MKSDNLEMIEVIKFIKEYEESGRKLLASEFVQEIQEMFNLEEENIIKIPKTNYPKEQIASKDKITSYLFAGNLSENLLSYAIEAKGKEELTVKVSINFNKLGDIQLSTKDFNTYDQEVYNAIVSLYVDGKNKYITPAMIYRVMVGNQKARLVGGSEKYNNIINSIEKCTVTRLYIDATKEMTGYKEIEDPIFKGNLIASESITGFHNGEKNEWIEILKTPILYRYANCKDQIARTDLKLLNTPLDKSDDVIILQSYLLRRIHTMKKSCLSKNIRCDTIYNQLNIDAKTPKALIKKQFQIRKKVKTILGYWKEEGFIKDYKENRKNKGTIDSFTISL